VGSPWVPAADRLERCLSRSISGGNLETKQFRRAGGDRRRKPGARGICGSVRNEFCARNEQFRRPLEGR
jgi:hypothetical protein